MVTKKLAKRLGGRGRTKEGRVAYAASGEVIRQRAKAVYGSMNKLSAKLGMSRQALHCRIISAEVWPLTHEWWGVILCIPTECITAGNADFRLPSENEVLTALSVQADYWEQADARKGEWNKQGIAVTDTAEATKSADE
jgi:hypothetical protein